MFDLESSGESSSSKESTKLEDSTESYQQPQISPSEWVRLILVNDHNEIMRVLKDSSEEDRRFWVQIELPITGSSILHHAAATVNLELMTKILNWNCGADLAKSNQMGETPLHVLASTTYPASHKEVMARLLLTHKDSPVNPLSRDIWGRRAVDLLPNEDEQLRKCFLGIEDVDPTLTHRSQLDGDNTKDEAATGKSSLVHRTSRAAKDKVSGKTKKISGMLSSRTKKVEENLYNNVFEPQPLYFTNCDIKPMSRSIMYKFPNAEGSLDDVNRFLDMGSLDYEKISLSGECTPEGPEAEKFLEQLREFDKNDSMRSSKKFRKVVKKLSNKSG